MKALLVFIGALLGIIIGVSITGTTEIYTPQDILYINGWGRVTSETGQVYNGLGRRSAQELISNVTAEQSILQQFEVEMLASNATIIVTDGDVYLTLTNEYTNEPFTIEMNQLDESYDELIYYFQD